ncbi:MAG: hypothetical protein PSU93_13535 [Methylobacter sp.]|uniref:Uncharacterized protein n=1 Tax=Candidatus Methylobacter titanis TaxID=3053457 RepID=A0AA43TMN6_9GAMM|nr:hypothetical protein [Candidatus Methylobacter titanis]
MMKLWWLYIIVTREKGLKTLPVIQTTWIFYNQINQKYYLEGIWISPGIYLYFYDKARALATLSGVRRQWDH